MNIPLDFVSGNIHQYSLRLRRIIVKYSDNIKREKVKRRKLERRLTIDQELYMEQCKRVNLLIHVSKMKFYTNKIEENTNIQRVLFSSFGKMLNTSAAKKLPPHGCPRNLANMFADYFESKVQRIRASFPTTTADPRLLDNCTMVLNFVNFLQQHQLI